MQTSNRLERRVLRPPHCLVHLLNRVMQRRLRQTLLLGRCCYGEGDGGGDHSQVGHWWQQARPGGAI